MQFPESTICIFRVNESTVMAYQVILNKTGLYRILLECYPEGVFVNIFDSAFSMGPVQDHYQPDLALAKTFCEETLGVDCSSWVEVPNETWH